MNRLVQVICAFCALIALGEYLRKDITLYEKIVALTATLLFLLFIVGIEVIFV